jgi:hypothetical protein
VRSAQQVVFRDVSKSRLEHGSPGGGSHPGGVIVMIELSSDEAENNTRFLDNYLFDLRMEIVEQKPTTFGLR